MFLPMRHEMVGQAVASGSIVTNIRKPAGDMQAGTDQRVLAGDEAGNRRKVQETT